VKEDDHDKDTEFFQPQLREGPRDQQEICDPQYRDVQVGKAFTFIITALFDFSFSLIAL
jgi:hypothetical protein